MLKRWLHILWGETRSRCLAVASRTALDRPTSIDARARRSVAADELLAADAAPVPERVDDLTCELRTGRVA